MALGIGVVLEYINIGKIKKIEELAELVDVINQRKDNHEL